jgi:hypothetical protein
VVVLKKKGIGVSECFFCLEKKYLLFDSGRLFSALCSDILKRKIYLEEEIILTFIDFN